LVHHCGRVRIAARNHAWTTVTVGHGALLTLAAAAVRPLCTPARDGAWVVVTVVRVIVTTFMHIRHTVASQQQYPPRAVRGCYTHAAPNRRQHGRRYGEESFVPSAVAAAVATVPFRLPRRWSFTNTSPKSSSATGCCRVALYRPPPFASFTYEHK